MTTAQPAPFPTDADEALARAQEGIGYWGRVWERLRADKVTLTVTGVLAAIVLMAIFAPLLATHDPLQGSILGRLKGFGYNGHLLGTDETGRDLFSRLLYGARARGYCAFLRRYTPKPTCVRKSWRNGESPAPPAKGRHAMRSETPTKFARICGDCR